jgi:hypothetical protein
MFVFKLLALSPGREGDAAKLPLRTWDLLHHGYMSLTCCLTDPAAGTSEIAIFCPTLF